MARPKSNGKDTSANLGFEAKLWLAADTASRGSAFLHTGGKMQVMTERQDNLRNNMDAAEPSGARQPARQGSPKGQRGGAEQYSRAERDRLPKAARRASAEAFVNHVVLGLIFLKYISDTFDEHHAKLKTGKGDFAGANPEDKDPARRRSARRTLRRNRIPQDFRGAKDQYLAANVLWVPKDARWAHLQSRAKRPGIPEEARATIRNYRIVRFERSTP